MSRFTEKELQDSFVSQAKSIIKESKDQASTNLNDLFEEIKKNIREKDSSEGELTLSLLEKGLNNIPLPDIVSSSVTFNINYPEYNLELLRQFEEKAAEQRINISKVLEDAGIPNEVLLKESFDKIYTEAIQLANQRLTDNSLYRARYRKCKKKDCIICKETPGHGPYWYRVFREGKKVKSQYVGKQLPFQALGCSSPRERFRFLLVQALKKLYSNSF